MRPLFTALSAVTVAALLATAAGNGLAETAQDAVKALPAVPPPPRLDTLPRVPSVASAASAAASAPAPALATNVVVIEDDDVRIEETKVRGQTRRIVVQSKVANVRPYEVLVAPAGKDSSQDRGTTGASAWSLFNF